MNENFYLKIKFISIHLIILLFSFFIISCNSSKDTTPDPNKMFVHYIDVGQGDCILIQVNSKNLLIDSGPKSDEKKLFNYLSNLNLQKLDYVIATHPHEDHIGNMAEVIKYYDVFKFYAPKVESTTKTFEKMVDALKDKNLKINVIHKGTNSIDLGNNTKITVFSPSKGYYEDLNNYSPVIKIEYGTTSFLFTGDAQEDEEKEILNDNQDIRSDVIKVGHHGSSTSTSKSFLDRVNPSVAVISVGQDNLYDHPNKNTLKRLSDSNIKIYRTDLNGTVLISSDGSKITVNTKT